VLDSAILSCLFLFAFSAPLSIAATQTAWLLGMAFWLIPVPALLAEWTQVMEESAGATQTAFEHINSAFQTHGAPADSRRVRTASRPARVQPA